MKRFTSVIATAAFLLCLVQARSHAQKAKLVLTEAHATHYSIIYEAANRNAMKAAAELARQFKAMTGVDFPIVPASADFQGAFISVGKTPKAERLGLKPEPSGKTTACVRAIGDNLFLYGSADHHDAVMAFLEGDLHCRFFTPEITCYPDCGNSLVAEVDSRTEKVSFERRLVFTDYGLLLDSDWYRHNRVKTWEHFDHPRDWLCHTYSKITPPTEFAKSPELFAVVNGKPSSTMICPTHPENIRRAKELVRKAMELNPGKKLFSISENDGGYPYCQCKRCLDFIHDHGDAPIAAHLLLVNEVARSVADRAPGQLVEFIVYTPSFHKTPANIAMEPNVCMWYCANLPKEKRASELREWKNLVKDISVWEYDVDFSDYFHITSMFPGVVDDLKCYNGLGISGIMLQEVFGVRGGDLQRLRAWVLAKLLWDTSLDADGLALEYCRGVYGAAAEEMFAYYCMVNAPGKASRTIEEHYDRKEFLDRADALFKAALAKTPAECPALKEIETDYLPVLITRANDIFRGFPENKPVFPVEEYRRLLDEITRITSDCNIPKISELVDMPGYLRDRRQLLDTLENNNSSFQVYAVDGRLYNYPRTSDPLAEGQRGVTRQFCDGSWLVQWVLPTKLMHLNRPYQLEAEFRIEKPSISTTAIESGVYDAVQKKQICTSSINGSELSTSEYRFIKLGKPFSISHRGEVYVYFTAPATSDVGSFYVNRIRLSLLADKD